MCHAGDRGAAGAWQSPSALISIAGQGRLGLGHRPPRRLDAGESCRQQAPQASRHKNPPRPRAAATAPGGPAPRTDWRSGNTRPGPIWPSSYRAAAAPARRSTAHVAVAGGYALASMVSPGQRQAKLRASMRPAHSDPRPRTTASATRRPASTYGPTSRAAAARHPTHQPCGPRQSVARFPPTRVAVTPAKKPSRSFGQVRRAPAPHRAGRQAG